MTTDSSNGKRQRIDLNSLASQRKGLGGAAEMLLRRFKNALSVLVLLPLYALGCVCIGIALCPGITLVRWTTSLTVNYPAGLQNLAIGVALGAGFFLYGFSAMFVVAAVNFMMRIKLRPWRGAYYSLETIPWYVHNGATYLLRYSFLEFVTPSPFNVFFYRLMGMTIGKGTIVNTSNISDPCLIELGDRVTIGGSVTIVGHYGQGGLLVLAPVKIGSGATIGLKASIMGGATIGERAKILPHSVVMPNAYVPPGEIWGGVPAQKITLTAKKAA